MEEVEQLLVQEEVETTLLVRKSRTENVSNTTEVADNGFEVSDGGSKTNGHTNHSELDENGAENAEETPEEEQKLLEQEEEDGTMLVRKSANGHDSNLPSKIAAVDFEVSDEVSATNGHAQLVENGADDEEGTPAGEQKVEEIHWVLEKEPEAINGKQKHQNMVYHDNVEGVESTAFTSLIEKQVLRDTSSKEFDISSLDYVIQSYSTSTISTRHEGKFESDSISSSLKSHQVSSQEGITSYESSKEIESADVDLINENDLEIPELEVERVIRKQTTHDLYCPNCNSCITKRVILRKRKRIIKTDEEVKRNKGDPSLVSKIGGDLVQPLIERADNDAQTIPSNQDELEKGPDLFRCLSCFSFFIPTVNGFRIFGKKSGKDNVGDERAPSVKKNWFPWFTFEKQKTVVEQVSVSQTIMQRGDVIISSSNSSDQTSFSQKPPLPANVSEEPVVTIGSSDASKVSISQTIMRRGDVIIPSSNSSDQASFLQKPPSPANVSEEPIIGNNDTSKDIIILGMTNTYHPNQRGEVHGNGESDSSEMKPPATTVLTGNAPPISANKGSSKLEESEEPVVTIGNSDASKGMIILGMTNTYRQYPTSESKTSQEVHGNGESYPSETKPPATNQKVHPGDAEKEIIKISPTSASVVQASDVDGTLNITLSIPHEDHDVTASIITDSVLENKNANFISSNSGHVHLSEGHQHLITKTKVEVSNDSLKINNTSVVKDAPDTVIIIDSLPPISPQTVQSIMHPSESSTAPLLANQTSVVNSERAEERREFEIEVVKSIVYGGLAESITSLSVVSSAAGGGAATLNVLALGAANLIGGLIILIQNLRDLRIDRYEQASNQINEHEDHYRELLGRRQHFYLHAIVAITSYLIFGLVPPVVYGFLFRQSDDRQYKLIALGAASLLCIIFLAIGKAYAHRPPRHYLKTVTTYVIMGFMASGIAYAAGELFERFLNELGLFQKSSVPNMAMPELRPTGSGWSPY